MLKFFFKEAEFLEEKFRDFRRGCKALKRYIDIMTTYKGKATQLKIESHVS